jgi:hypothetical protein
LLFSGLRPVAALFSTVQLGYRAATVRERAKKAKWLAQDDEDSRIIKVVQQNGERLEQGS